MLITGGTGLVGSHLTKYLTGRGYSVIILSRNPATSEGNVTYAKWDVAGGVIDTTAIAEADYIVTLAGAGLMEERWTANYKKEIIQSRVQGNELVVKTLKECSHKVKALIAVSAIGWYGSDPAPSAPAFVESDPAATDFIAEVCRQWEESIEPVRNSGIQLVHLRLGIVLSREGGAWTEFIKPFRFGIAPVHAGGKQVISWIHIEDLSRLFLFAIEKEIQGQYNAVSPEPVTNKAFMLAAAKKLRGQFFIPLHIPAFAFKLLLGRRSSEILKSSTVSADKIRSAGFTFLYPSLGAALEELSKK